MHDSALLAPGSVFYGRYRIVKRLAAGGMGAVYEVLDEKTDKRRALKVMLPRALEDSDFRARFQREAKVTGAIESDHVVLVSDAGIDDATGAPFLVMELLSGEELAMVVDRTGALPTAEALTYLFQAARGLDKTHAAGIVHRDLKPENLFLTHADDGSPRIKILDFGIAKVLEPGGSKATRALGTPMYMAPEQMRGAGVGAQTDIYALGHIAYTLLAGEPYWAEEEQEANDALLVFLQKVANGAQESAVARALRRQNVSLPQGFDAWFLEATALDPAQRFPRATVAIAALAQVLGASDRVSAYFSAPVLHAERSPGAGSQGQPPRSGSGPHVEPATTNKNWGSTVGGLAGAPSVRVGLLLAAGAALLIGAIAGTRLLLGSGASAPAQASETSTVVPTAPPATAEPSPTTGRDDGWTVIPPDPSPTVAPAEPPSSTTKTPNSMKVTGTPSLASPTAASTSAAKPEVPGVVDPWAPKPSARKPSAPPAPTKPMKF